MVTPSPGNNNNGSATWTYSAADTAFNFLTAGETLTLTYNAVVNNNYLPLDQVASVPFTITINGTSGEEWIHPTGGLWSVGSNWSSGTAPTATDDAIIPAQNIPGGTGLYDVRIETPAVARTLTLNANDTTGGEVTNDSTLTIGETLTIFNDGVLNNSGTVSVGTQIELLNQSSLQNSGLITLGQGGDFADSSGVTNSGTIEIAGGTLNVEVDIANKGGSIQVDAGAILTPEDGATISNGNLIIGTLGVLDVEKGLATLPEGKPDATLDGVAVANGGNIEIGTAGTSDPTLLLDDGTVVSNGNLTIGALGVLDVEQGPATLGAGVPDATLDGVAVANGGNIEIGTAGTSDPTLLLDDGTVISNGNLTIGAFGVLDVEQGPATLGAGVPDATLDGVGVANSGNIKIGTATGDPTLLLDDGTVISNGNMTIGALGVLDVEQGPNPPATGTPDATLDGVAVANSGNIDIGTASTGDPTLLLDDGTVISNGNMTIGALGVLDVEQGAATLPEGTPDATLDGVAVANSGNIHIGTASTGDPTLLLDDGTVISNGNMTIGALGVLDVEQGAATLPEGTPDATLDGVAVANSGNIDIGTASTGDPTLLLDDGTVISNGNMTIGALGVLDVEQGAATLPEGTPDATLGGVTVANGGNIDVSGALLLDQGTTITNNGAGAITVEITGTLTLDGATISDGATVKDGTVTNQSGGEIDLTGNAVLESGSLGNAGDIYVTGIGNALTNETVTANHLLEVKAGGALTIDPSTVANGGTIQVDAASGENGAGQLTLNGTTITGGTVLDNGTLSLTGNAAIQNGSLTNNGTFTVSGSGNALDGEQVANNTTLEVLGALTVDQGSTITNESPTAEIKIDLGGTLTLDGATLATVTGGKVDDEGTLSLAGNAAIQNGSLTNNGTFTVSGSGNALDGEQVANNTTLEVLGALTVDQGSVITNGAGGKVQIDATGQLTVNGATVKDGTVTNQSGGEIDLTGNAVLESGSLGNAGDIYVTGIGNALTNETVTANHLLEVKAGGALTIDPSTVANGGTIQVDAASGENGAGQLTLNGTTITGGTVLDNGTLSLTGNAAIQNGSLTNNGTFTVSGSGNALDGEQVANNTTLEVLGALTVDQGSTITNESPTAEIKIDLGGTLTLDGATLATVTGGKVDDEGTLSLAGNAAIQNGSLTNNGTFTVSGSGNALDGEQVANNTTLEVLGALTVDQGSVITNGAGGKVQIDATGQLTVNGATVKDGTVTNQSGGEIDLTGNAVLESGSLGNAGDIYVTGIGNALTNETVTANHLLEVKAGGALTIDPSTVANGGTIQVDAASGENGAGQLTLNGTTITGGTVLDNGTLSLTGNAAIQNGSLTNNGTFTVSGSGNALDGEQVANNTTLEVLGALTVDQGSTITNESPTAEIKIDLGGTLTLDGATLATVTGGKVDDEGTLSLAGNAAIQNGSLTNNGTFTVSGSGNALDGEQVANNTTLEVLGALTVDQGSVITNGAGGKVQIDATGQLTVNGATVKDGTVTNQSGGEIDLTGNAVLESGSLGNAGDIYVTGIGNALTNETVTANHLLEVKAGGALTIDPSTVANGGTIQVDAASGENGAGQLTLNGTTITGGTVLDNGTLSLTGNAAIQNGSLTNNGTFTVSGSGNALDGEQVANNTTLEVLGALTVDQGSTITNESPTAEIKIDLGGTLTLDGATLATVTGGKVDDEGTLSLAGNAAIQNGSLTNNGTFTVSGSGNALDGEQVANNTTLEVLGALTVDQGSVITNGAGGKVQIDATGQLTVNGATVKDGTVTNQSGGEIDLTGNAVLESGSLGNAGDIYVTGIGNALTNETVTANHLLEVKAGGALTIDPSTVTNGKTQVDDGGKLTLNATTVTGGTVINQSGGEIDLTGFAVLLNGSLGNAGDIYVTGIGNALTGETVTANNLLEVKAGGALTIDPSTVTNGTTQVDSGGQLTVNGTTIKGGTVLINGTLALTGNAAIQNGSLTNNGVFTVAGTGNALDGEQAANNTTLEVLGALTVDQGSMIINGAGGKVQIDTTGQLMLNGATMKGGTLSGPGTIATVGGADTFNNVAIAVGTTVNVTDNTTLDLIGTIANSGTIALNSSGDTTQLEISGNVLLDGGGHVTLTDNTHNAIVSGGSAATLTNSDTITGAGTIGDTYLTLVNSGTIDATGTHPLTIGSLTVTNNTGAVLEASAGHTLQIDDNVLNDGLIAAGNTGGTSVAVVNVTGNITGTGSIELFDNAKFEIGGSVSSGQIVNFEVSNGAAELILDDPHGFQGLVAGLVEASSEAAENYIDLKGFAYTAQTKVVSALFDKISDVTAVTITNGNSANNITIDLSGDYQKGDIEFANDGSGGTLFSDPAANSGAVTIDSGTTLDIAAASTATVGFANSSGHTGELVLANSNTFTGQIVGFAGDGTIANSDLIDLADVNIANVATNQTSYIDNGNGTGTLTLYNANGQALDSITFDGSYQLANFTIEDDGSGHTLIVDPPVSSGAVTVGNGVTAASTPSSSVVVNDPGPAVNSVIMHDPGPQTSSTIVASVPNQTLSGFAASDTFVFNFATVGHTTVTDFHPGSDTLQFKSPIFESALAALNAAQDDGHGNTVIAIDAHDTVTLSGVLKAQLHGADFHVV